MGLRCLLGHDFGPPEMEREREENGDEMVVTVREVKTCRRCGEERVVSENKEVTAIRSPDEVDLDERDGEDGRDESETVARDGAETTSSTPEPPETPSTDAPDAPTPEHPPGGEDDGVILDDGAEREHGEWPDSDDTAASESADRVDAAAEAMASPDDADDGPADETEHAGDEGVELIDDAEDGAAGDADEGDGTPAQDAAEHGGAEEHDGVAGRDESEAHGGATEHDAPAAASSGEAESWPDHDGDDEGFDASQASGGGPADVSFGGGLTPDAGANAEAPDDRTHGEYVGVDGPDDEEFEDIVRVDSDAEGDVTEFFCPNCGLSERAGETSMRVGDICPSCHKGYIAERTA